MPKITLYCTLLFLPFRNFLNLQISRTCWICATANHTHEVLELVAWPLSLKGWKKLTGKNVGFSFKAHIDLALENMPLIGLSSIVTSLLIKVCALLRFGHWLVAFPYVLKTEMVPVKHCYLPLDVYNYTFFRFRWPWVHSMLESAWLQYNLS